MPIRRISSPDTPDPTSEGPSLLRRLLAGGVRAGAGVLGVEGGATGAGITGAGEGIAEMIEGSPLSAARIGVEAGLGAVPFGKIISAGKPWLSTIRSGAFSGVGEGMREIARGEDVDPRSIGRSALLGGIFGNVFGRIGGPKVETPPAGPSYEVEHTAVPGGRVLDENGKLTPVGSRRVIRGTPEEPSAPPSPSVDPRTSYWNKRGMNPPTAPGRMASPQYQLPFEGELEQEIASKGNVPYMGSGAYPSGSAAKSAAKAAKEAEKAAQQQAIQDRIDRAIEEGKLVEGKTSVSESGSVETPEGRQSYRKSWVSPKKEEDGGDAGFKVISDEPTLDEPIAEGTPAIAEPEAPAPTPLGKLLKSAAPKTPRIPKVPKVLTPQQEAAQRSYDELLARIKAEGGATPPEAPIEPPVAPEGPSTPRPGYEAQRFGSVDPYAGGLSHLSGMSPLEGLPEGSPEFRAIEEALRITPSPSNLERITPTFKGLEPVSEGAGAAVEGATQGLSPLARLFKSRVDAAGQGYRDIKAALAGGEAVPEEGRAIAGKALRQEGKAAGLPPTSPRPTPEDRLRAVFDPDARLQANAEQAVVQPPTEPPVSPGLSQTAKARAAALAKRQAAKAAAQQEAAKTQEWLPDFEKELAEAQRMKAAGATPEQIQQTLSERLKGETGAISPEMLARLGMTATGAALGGLFGGSEGHPLAGMAIGGAAGAALSPNMIAAGLKQLGLHPQAAEEAKNAVSSPEGVTSIARRLYAGLPQFQRFNLLMDAWGLPANAIAGPYGSAAMAGLEAHLSGDPRGMEVLRNLHPENFMRRWNAAREEAQKLVAEGELGRAETQITGAGPVQNLMQWPGVQMTAGDVAARQILMEAGFSEEEARRITMTAEPETAAAKKVANLSKGSPLLQMLQPFARTPANIAEQGAYRTPIIGSLAQILGRETPDPVRQQLVQQGLGLATGAAGYAAGSTLDPETARVVRRYLTNLGGQYSLPVGLGFAAGQAVQSGSDPISAQTAANLYNALPLPSTAPLASWTKAATTGNPARGWMPNTLVDILTPSNTSQANPLTRPGRFRR